MAQITKFKNLTMADGLSHSFVHSIEQDQYGFIWLGTQNGLNIYDGTRFRHYLHNSSDENISFSNSIIDLILDGDSAWVAAGNAMLIMDIKTKRYRNLNIGNKDIRTVLLDKNNETLWIGTNTGLLEYSISSGNIREYNTANSNISHDIIRALYKGDDGTLWIGTYDKLNKLAQNSSIFEVVDLNPSTSSSQDNQLVLSIKPQNTGKDSVLLIGTQKNGLLVLNQKTNQKTFYNQKNTKLANNVIKAIEVSSSGKIWLGTDFGLAEVDEQLDSKIHFHNPLIENSLSNSVIWDIFEDNSGAIWLATNNGVSIHAGTKERFQYHPIAINNQENVAGCEVRSIINFENNNLLLSTQNGLIQYNNPTKGLKVLKSPLQLINDTKDCLIDKSGNIWIASNGGVSVIDNKGKRRNFTATTDAKNGLRSNYIDNLFELDDGTILINTNRGVHKVIQSDGTMNFEFIGDYYINSIGNGYLWNTFDSTLFRINEKTFERQAEVSFIIEGKGVDIYSMLLGENNKIWIGYENGLIEYNQVDKTYKHYKIQSNNQYPLISLLNDNDGNIWASSYSSILKFSISTEEFEIYPSGDEIPINRFIENACLKTKSGELIFGGHDGFIKFSPASITKSDYTPPIRLTKFSILNKEVIPETKIEGKYILSKDISFTDQLNLDYKNSSFSIEFSSLIYGNRNGIQYRYILEGKDDSWSFVHDHFGHATYSKLPAGDYTFKVRGTNNDGVWNTDETSLKIVIKPPLWASIGFIVGYFIFVFILVNVLIFYLINRAKFKTQLKIINLEKEHAKDLATKRQQFLTNIAHEFRTPLSLIVGPLEKIYKNIALDKKNRSYLNLIENNTKRLLWLNNQLLDFRKIENNTIKLIIGEFELIEFANSVFILFKDLAESKNIKYEFTSETTEQLVFLDIRKIETILYNLLSNALKFTPDNGEIKQTIKTVSYKNDVALQIEISDTGIGIPEKDQNKIFNRFYQSKAGAKLQRGSGIGLTLVNEYVKIHKGDIEVISSPGMGTTFKIILPLNHEPVDTPLGEVSKPLIESYKPEVSTQTDLSDLHSNQYILLIEDDKEFADFLCMSLREKYDVFWTPNGKEALRAVYKKIPALVISDISMPEMSGVEFTKKLKSNQKTAHVPVILISGQDQNENQVEGLQSGADAYMIKPFVIELLELRIANFLKHDKQIVANLEITNLSKPKEKKISTQDEIMLKKVVETIEEFMADSDLNVEKLCAETGFNYTYLYRKIKNITGQSVNELIRTMRIRRAAQILSTQKVSVADAMHETGFTSHSYFSKCFRKVYDMSPKEYMNKI